MSDQDQARLGGEWERTVIGREDIDRVRFAREVGRYEWAAGFIKPGMTVVEFGCSSGFGTRFLPPDIEYTGVDYDPAIVEFATEQFGDAHHTFCRDTIDDYLARLGPGTVDVILAFEVLEHVSNGRELAQRLKQHCRTLLLTTPFREPPGFWGKHHVLHQLEERDFPGFRYGYMHPNGAVERYATSEPANLLLMEWHEGEDYPARPRVLCAIPTRGRYDALLHCLQAVAVQTRKPDKLVIYDDTPKDERLDLRQHRIGQYMLPLLDRFGIGWECVWPTPEGGRGQHLAHQMANSAGFDLVWRLDDDCVPEPDVLERLLAHLAPEVGAVGGAVYELARPILGGTSTLRDFHLPNVQWAPDHGLFRDVDYLYSSFLYRAGIVDYKHTMSPVAFHEETIFTHRLKRAGYRLIADTSIRTHHFKAPHGGTRGRDYEWAYRWDHDEFLKVAREEWGVRWIYLGVGLGDCLAFRQIIPELVAKYQLVLVGSCYPEVFKDDPVVTVPYDRGGEAHSGNVYDLMQERSWQPGHGNLVDAFRELYL